MTYQPDSLTSDSLVIASASLPIGCVAQRLPEFLPTNGQPSTLAEVVDHEAMAYRAWGTPTGDFLARQMERLAQLVRWTNAATPADHEARMEVWDDEIREQWFDRGYQEGFEAGRREAGRNRRPDRD